MAQFDRASTAEDVARAADLRGKVAVVTGASSGIGVETARALALAGAEVVMAVRDGDRGAAAAADIGATTGRAPTVLTLDLADLASVARFAEALLEGRAAIDLLIANAGVSKTPDRHLPNGLDVRFATNHLGHFALAHRLKPALAARGARIVMVSSAGHKNKPVRLDDLQWRTREYQEFVAYGESKTANILFAREASRRWGGEGIFVNAVLPGSAQTGLQRHHGDDLKRAIGFIRPDGSLNPMLKTVAQAAATTLWAATAPELAGRGGLVLEDCAEALPVGPDTHPWSGFDHSVADDVTAGALWEASIALVRAHGPEGLLQP